MPTTLNVTLGRRLVAFSAGSKARQEARLDIPARAWSGHAWQARDLLNRLQQVGLLLETTKEAPLPTGGKLAARLRHSDPTDPSPRPYCRLGPSLSELNEC
jgi:hypothetical protein